MADQDNNGAEAPIPTNNTSIFTSNVPLPPKIQLKGNLANNWKTWKQIWDAYELVTKNKEQSHQYRVATFITVIGREAIEIHNGLPFANEDEKQDMDKILELWQNYCMGKTNITYERYTFNLRNQEEHESIETYATALRRLAETCNFGQLKDELIRDRIVYGLRENEIRKKLLQYPDLTLDKCLNICRSAEATTSQLKVMNNELHYIKTTSQHQSTNPKSSMKNAKSEHIKNCKYCGQSHDLKREKCPAYGKICSNCGKSNHFAQKCSKKGRQVNTISDVESNNSSEEDLLTIEEVNSLKSKSSHKIYAKIEVNRQRVKMLVDTGATCNVIPVSLVPKVTKRQAHYRCIANQPLQLLGLRRSQ